jgi:hypothetical protein
LPAFTGVGGIIKNTRPVNPPFSGTLGNISEHFVVTFIVDDKFEEVDVDESVGVKVGFLPENSKFSEEIVGCILGLMVGETIVTDVQLYIPTPNSKSKKKTKNLFILGLYNHAK